MSDPFVSAVIPAYNCEHTIAKTIEALLHFRLFRGT